MAADGNGLQVVAGQVRDLVKDVGNLRQDHGALTSQVHQMNATVVSQTTEVKKLMTSIASGELGVCKEHDAKTERAFDEIKKVKAAQGGKGATIKLGKFEASNLSTWAVIGVLVVGGFILQHVLTKSQLKSVVMDTVHAAIQDTDAQPADGTD